MVSNSSISIYGLTLVVSVYRRRHHFMSNIRRLIGSSPKPSNTSGHGRILAWLFHLIQMNKDLQGRTTNIKQNKFNKSVCKKIEDWIKRAFSGWFFGLNTIIVTPGKMRLSTHANVNNVVLAYWFQVELTRKCLSQDTYDKKLNFAQMLPTQRRQRYPE